MSPCRTKPPQFLAGRDGKGGASPLWRSPRVVALPKQSEQRHGGAQSHESQHATCLRPGHVLSCTNTDDNKGTQSCTCRVLRRGLTTTRVSSSSASERSGFLRSASACCCPFCVGLRSEGAVRPPAPLQRAACTRALPAAQMSQDAPQTVVGPAACGPRRAARLRSGRCAQPATRMPRSG